MNTLVFPKKMVRSRKGQSIIELTFITPLLLVLLLSMVEFGTLVSNYLTLTHLTREGANLASRGTTPAMALDTVIASAATTFRNDNEAQWKVIFSTIVQTPNSCPPLPCTYQVGQQITRGNLSESSKLGAVGKTVKIPGIDGVSPNQTFFAIEAYYDYRSDVPTVIIGNTSDTIIYDRTIFTNVSSI